MRVGKTQLSEIIKEIRCYRGIKRKACIWDIYELLKDGGIHWGFDSISYRLNFAEDAAIIPHSFGSNLVYLLLAADGIMSEIIEESPYAAGKAAVTVNVNDIYAMGGRPLAMVNVVSCTSKEILLEILRGIRKGCEKFRVPMVGGHTHQDASYDSVSVAILGIAESLLRSSTARAGEHIILAVDLRGRITCRSVKSWDSTSGKTSQEVINRLEVLNRISTLGLSQTAKDVSNGGILGTVAILLEASGVGGIVDLSKIPTPPFIDLLDWLKAHLSYGFVLTSKPCNTQQVLDMFAQEGVEASVIGEVINERRLYLRMGDESGVLYDFGIERITGVSKLQAKEDSNEG